MSVHDLLAEENFMIGIPTRGRHDHIKGRKGVWRYLDKGYPTVLAVRESEEVNYQWALADSEVFPHVTVGLVSDESSICSKRKGLMDEAIRRGVEYLFIIDDNTTFSYRDDLLPSKYCSKLPDIERMEVFDRILYESLCLCGDVYPIVGLPLRKSGFNVTYIFQKNIPITKFVCYHVPTFMKEEIEINGLGMSYLSDRYVQLSLLEKGYASLSNCRFMVGESETVPMGDLELRYEADKALKTRFPEAVTLKRGEGGVIRKIYWRKYLREEEQKYLNYGMCIERIKDRRKGYDEQLR